MNIISVICEMLKERNAGHWSRMQLYGSLCPLEGLYVAPQEPRLFSNNI